MLHAIYEFPIGFIYVETPTPCPSVIEMYQISVCRVKSKLRFLFWISPQNACKFTTFFSKSKILGALFLVFTAKVVKIYEKDNEFS